jgi:hypothetical protein
MLVELHHGSQIRLTQACLQPRQLPGHCHWCA